MLSDLGMLNFENNGTNYSNGSSKYVLIMIKDISEAVKFIILMITCNQHYEMLL